MSTKPNWSELDVQLQTFIQEINAMDGKQLLTAYSSSSRNYRDGDNDFGQGIVVKPCPDTWSKTR